MLACALLRYTLTNPTFVINVIAKDWPRSVVSWGTLMSNSIVIIGSQPTSDDSVSELMVWTLNSNYTASYIYYWFVIAVVCFVLLFGFFFHFFIFKQLFVSTDDFTHKGFRAYICPLLSLLPSTFIIIAIVLMLQKFTYLLNFRKKLAHKWLTIRLAKISKPSTLLVYF